jgi:hypothetical protein
VYFNANYEGLRPRRKLVLGVTPLGAVQHLWSSVPYPLVPFLPQPKCTRMRLISPYLHCWIGIAERSSVHGRICRGCGHHLLPFALEASRGGQEFAPGGGRWANSAACDLSCATISSPKIIDQPAYNELHCISVRDKKRQSLDGAPVSRYCRCSEQGVAYRSLGGFNDGPKQWRHRFVPQALRCVMVFFQSVSASAARSRTRSRSRRSPFVPEAPVRPTHSLRVPSEIRAASLLVRVASQSP